MRILNNITNKKEMWKESLVEMNIDIVKDRYSFADSLELYVLVQVSNRRQTWRCQDIGNLFEAKIFCNWVELINWDFFWSTEIAQILLNNKMEYEL